MLGSEPAFENVLLRKYSYCMTVQPIVGFVVLQSILCDLSQRFTCISSLISKRMGGGVWLQRQSSIMPRAGFKIGFDTAENEFLKVWR